MQRKNRNKIIIICITGLLICGLFYAIGNKSVSGGVEEKIQTAIRIQYGWGFPGTLNNLCTEEFLNSAEESELYLGRKIYSLDEDMSVNYLGDKVKVSVNVYCPDIVIHKYTLTKSDDGEYLICDIEYDI